MATIPGFDLDKLNEFSEYAGEHPNDVILGLEAKTIWEGRSGESLAKIGPWELAGERIDKPTRDFSIQFGAWKEVEEAMGVEGAQDRIEPVEAALAAMCACVNWAITINAARQELEIGGLEISAKAKVDPRVLFGVVPVEEAESCLKSVDLNIKVLGDVSDEVRAKIKDMALRSPVHSMITGRNSVTTTVSTG